MIDFLVGQRLINKYTRQACVVTEVREDQFDYKMDHIQVIGSRIGSYEFGTCFKQGFYNYELHCDCAKCSKNEIYMSRMILCAVCGNKRCPHATDHNYPCTNSNEPGQKGSSYA